MDRVPVSEAGDAGSIPAWGKPFSKVKNLSKKTLHLVSIRLKGLDQATWSKLSPKGVTV